jgi:hypothetical protein
MTQLRALLSPETIAALQEVAHPPRARRSARRRKPQKRRRPYAEQRREPMTDAEIGDTWERWQCAGQSGDEGGRQCEPTPPRRRPRIVGDNRAMRS